MANKILQSTPSAQWFTSKCEKDLKTISNELIKVLGKIATTAVYNNWICVDACLTVIEDEHKLIIGKEFFSFGLVVVQQQAKRGKVVNNFDNSANASKNQMRIIIINLEKCNFAETVIDGTFPIISE